MKALIIEDEILAAKHLIHVIDEVGNIEVIATTESIAETVEWFKINKKPDIVFMDIHLADGSAFEIFSQIDITCPIIFTTAYDEYAIDAFKVNSIAYLLKPIETAAVKDSLNKLKEIRSTGSINDLQNLIETFREVNRYKTHFLIPVKGDKLIPLQTSDIAFIYIEAGIVKARTFDEKSFRFESTLDELGDMLDPQEFFRANRQFIVSRKSIRDIDLWFNSRLSLNLTVSVPEKILISKARITDFKKWF
jgi:DNA-binding LytR/AlgR family response regulator